MRASDMHVHPMNQAYVQASVPFMPAAKRRDEGDLKDRPDTRIASIEGFRPGVIEKPIYQNVTRIFKLEKAVARATEART